MEIHRLKPMPAEYDEAVFKDIYQKTEKLRNKLVYEIDARRFGVEREDIKSWFDCKFIFAFTQYYSNQEPEALKAYIIRSLQFFKCRILRKAYTQESVGILSQVDILEVAEYGEEMVSIEEEDPRITKVKKFFKDNLSSEAYNLFLVQLDTPSYIVSKYMGDPKRVNNPTKEDFADFFDTTPSEIEKLQKQIAAITKKARLHLN